MSESPAPTVGVSGVPHVAAALRQLGVHVITGASFRDAAVNIAAQLKQTKTHVIVEAKTEPGFAPWVKAINAKSLGVILLPTDPDVDLSQLSDIAQLPLPGTVADLLEAVGIDAAGDAAATVVEVIGAAEPAVAVPSPSPAPAASDPFAFLGEAAPVPVADALAVEAPSEPADEQAVTAEAVSAPEVSDPFAGLVPPAAVARAVSDPFDAPAAIPDPFLAPAAADAVVTDPFAGALGTPSSPTQDFLTPSVETPTFRDAPDTSFDAFLNAATPSVPKPVTTAPAVLDPFAADSVTGDDTAAEAPATAPEPTFDLPMPEVPTSDGPDKQSLMQRMRARREEAAAEAVAGPAEPTPYELPTPHQTFEPAPAPVPADLPVPVQPVVHAPSAVPTPAVAGDGLNLAPRPVSADVDFFGGTGISAGGSQVVFSVAGKGGAGKTTNSLFYAQTAGGGGVKTLVIDANRDQGDIGTSLRIDKVGFPTILEALRSGPEGAVVTKTAINNARPNAAQDITFDVVLAPPRDFAGPKYASAELYAQVLAWAKPRYDLIVIDTQIIEAHKSDLHTGFVIPELRSGAWSAGIALYDYSAIRNAFSVFEELSALGVTATRSLIVATRWPERDSDTDKFNSQFGQYGTFLGFVGDDPNINAQKSVGNLLVASPAIEPVVRALLHRVTGNSVFAPVEDTGKKRGKKAPAAAADATPSKKRFGLFGRSK